MVVKLSRPIASDGAVDEVDVRRIKKALNRLGLYQPYEKTGVTGIPDADMFSALKAFQKSQDFPPTGIAKPGDATVDALNEAVRRAPKGNYIWRTVEDDRVRASHAAFNRTIRSWKDDPDPGEEPNCRCWAKPVDHAEGLSQKVISPINDAPVKWETDDFLLHYYFGKGLPKTLQEIGYLGDVVEKAREIMFHRVENQVSEKMRQIKEGQIVYETYKSYPRLSEVKFELGGGTISTRTEGIVRRFGNILSLQATVKYEYDDTFTDIVNIRENKFVYGTSSPEGIHPWIVKLTDVLGTYYKISDNWITRMTGSIYLNTE